MVQDVAQQAEAVRDLKGQIAGLDAEALGEMVFTLDSPGRKKITVYSMKTGEPIEVPRYRLAAVMGIRQGGQYAFTADPAKAPEYVKGQVKCFMHPDAPERPILDEIGLEGKFCMSAHLPSEYQKRRHAEHRHRDEWGAYQEYLDDQRMAEQEARQQRQHDATLRLLEEHGGAPQEVEWHCPACGKTGTTNKDAAAAVRMHQRLHCPARQGANND